MDKTAKSSGQDAKSTSKSTAEKSPKAEAKPAETKSAAQSGAKKPTQIVAIVAAVIAVLALAGLYFLDITGNDDSNVSTDEVKEEIIETNCSIAECMTKISVEDSTEKITEVIGVEPEVDDSGDKAKWTFSSKENITREKSSGSSKYTVQATVDKNKIKNENLDFSIFTDLKKELEGGESFTYDELVKRLGGVQGTLASLTDTSKRYIWVDNHNQTFSATFSNKNGKCIIISLK